MDITPRRALAESVPIVVLALYAFLSVFVWSSDAWRPEWDSAIYVLTGKSLAEGHGYQYLGAPFTLRPPGLSWLIGLVEGVGDFDPAPLNRMIMVFAALSVGAVYHAFRSGRSRFVPLAAAILAGTSPMFVSRFNWIQSEFPFVATLYLGFGLLAASLDSRRRGRVLAAAAGGAFAASVYFRTAGVLVLPVLAFVACLPGRRAARGRLAIAAVVLGLFSLPWFVHTSLASRTLETPPDQLLLHGYGTAVFHADPGDPGSPRIPGSAWADRIRSNGTSLATDLARSVFGAGPAWLGAGLVALTLTGMALARGGASLFLALFGLVYGAVLLTYFAYATRLVTPLVPIVYAYGLTAIAGTGRFVAARIGAPRAGSLLPAACALLLFAVNVAELPRRLDRPQVSVDGRQVDLGASWDDTFATAAWLREHTPPGSTLLCFAAPVYAVLTGRTAYTYRFPRGRDLLAKYDPDFVIFDMRSPATRPLESFVAGRAAESWSLPPGAAGRITTVYRLARD